MKREAKLIEIKKILGEISLGLFTRIGLPCPNIIHGFSCVFLVNKRPAELLVSEIYQGQYIDS
jgi:hypothetical protein